jgi:hypothetical protein
MSGAKVSGPLIMRALQLAGALYLNDKAGFTDIGLLDARVGGFLNLRQSKVAGTLDLESIEVHGNVFLGDCAEFSGPVDLIFSNVGELELANGTFHSDVDITGAEIRSDLVLGPLSTHWVDGTALILHNAKANAVQDTSDAWPAKLDLPGFTYRSLAKRHGRLSLQWGGAARTPLFRPSWPPHTRSRGKLKLALPCWTMLCRSSNEQGSAGLPRS